MVRHTTTKKRLPSIQAVDLFCGVGGLTHGMLRAGINVRAGIDIDPHCKFPFESNNEAKFIQGDVGQMQAESIGQLFRGNQLTLLAGCSPCQPFSTYSRSGRNRHYESQWPLLLNFGRFVSELQPTLITMENVPQLLDHKVFNSFLGYLEGYSVWWKVVDCTSFRIPQTRKRLVLLGSKLGAEKLELIESGDDPVTVGQTLGHLRSLSAGEDNPADPLHVAPSLSDVNLDRIKASIPGGTWRDWPAGLRAKCHLKASGQTYPSVYGRMEWGKPSPTITTQSYGYGNGRFGHPEQNRAITLREAAMIQTFPETYKFVASPSEVRFNRLGRLIGNAVPVQLGEEIGKALIQHVEHYQQVAHVIHSNVDALPPSPQKVARVEAAVQDRLDELMGRNIAGKLSVKERRELERLVEEAERLSLENARLLAGLGKKSKTAARPRPVHAKKAAASSNSSAHPGRGGPR